MSLYPRDPNLRSVQLESADKELKHATRALAKAFGTQTDAGKVIDKTQECVSAAGLTNTGVFLTLDEVAHLEDHAPREGQWPQVTRALAARQGFVLLPMPAGPTGASIWHQKLSEAAKESGEFFASVASALADRRIDAVEAGTSLKEMDEFLTVALEMRAMLQSVVDGEE